MIDTFVKDLPCKDDVRADYLEAMDSFLYEWTASMIPYYEEFKRREADVFECENVTTFGEDWAECYERDGIHFRYSESPLWGWILSLNGGAGHKELNWRRCFWKKFPEFDGSKIENYSDERSLSWYFQRYRKKNPQYYIVTDRIREHFRDITGDSDIVLDVGWVSYIYKNPRIRRIIDRHL